MQKGCAKIDDLSDGDSKFIVDMNFTILPCGRTVKIPDYDQILKSCSCIRNCIWVDFLLMNIILECYISKFFIFSKRNRILICMTTVNVT